jgi:hypothetical protein
VAEEFTYRCEQHFEKSMCKMITDQAAQLRRQGNSRFTRRCTGDDDAVEDDVFTISFSFGRSDEIHRGATSLSHHGVTPCVIVASGSEQLVVFQPRVSSASQQRRDLLEGAFYVYVLKSFYSA